MWPRVSVLTPFVDMTEPLFWGVKKTKSRAEHMGRRWSEGTDYHKMNRIGGPHVHREIAQLVTLCGMIEIC